MSESMVHEAPDGARFRITLVQAVREQMLFKGATFTFQVAPAGGEPGSADEEGTSGDKGSGQERAPSDEGAFTVTVHYAPIFMNIASPADRLQTDTWAREMVVGLVNRGHRENARLMISSDGAIKLGGELLARLYPLTNTP